MPSRSFAFMAALLVLTSGLLIGVVSEGAFRKQVLRDLQIQTVTLADSVVAPLMFGDTDAAQDNAQALAANPNIVAVGVYGANGALMASYVRKDMSPLPGTVSAVREAQFAGAYIEAAAAVTRDRQRFGAVFVRKSADTPLVFLGRYVPIALLAIMAALVLMVAGAGQAALRRANDELVGANARLTDEIAQRHQAEEALVQSRKMEAIGQLTGGVAHDFNNLLMVVSGGLRLLDRQSDPAQRQKIVDAMHQAVERGAGLTRQLLAFGRRQPLQFKTIDVEAQIGGMRELLERSLRADIILDMHFPAGLPPIRTDPGPLELAILNLAVNARDAMPKGGVLTITAAHNAAAAAVDIIVRDTGAGIAPEVLPRIFEPYFTTKQLGQGTGLGLSQIYGFAQQNQGSVRVETQVSVGSSFFLSLPVSDEPLQAEGEARATHPIDNAKALTILVVEDNDQVAATVCALLKEIGHAPHRTSSAAEALTILERGRRFDLVFSDIVMPGGKSGVELATELEQLAPELPVLLTTGYSGGGDIKVNRPLLRKPYQMQELVDAISSLMATR